MSSIIISALSGFLNIKNSQAVFENALDESALFSIAFDAAGAGLVASGVSPASHTHQAGDLLGVSPASHTHQAGDLLGVAPASHTHQASDLLGVLKLGRVCWVGDGVLKTLSIPFAVVASSLTCFVFSDLGAWGVLTPNSFLGGSSGALSFKGGLFSSGVKMGSQLIFYPLGSASYEGSFRFDLTYQGYCDLLNKLNVNYCMLVLYS